MPRVETRQARLVPCTLEELPVEPSCKNKKTVGCRTFATRVQRIGGGGEAGESTARVLVCGRMMQPYMVAMLPAAAASSWFVRRPRANECGTVSLILRITAGSRQHQEQHSKQQKNMRAASSTMRPRKKTGEPSTRTASTHTLLLSDACL